MSVASEDERTAEALLEAARRAGAEAADVMVVSSTSLGVGVAERALEEAERAESVDLGLRVLIGRRQACVAAADARPETLRDMAERAVTIARETPEDPYCGLADPAALGRLADAGVLELRDPAEPPTPGRLEHLARAAEEAALAVEGVAMVEQASAGWSLDRVTLMATNGLQAVTERTSWSTAAAAIAGTGLGRERDFAFESRRFAADLPDPDEIGARAGHRAVAALGPKRPPSGRFPVLYDERVSGSLIGHLLGAINGGAIARGSSWLLDAMGTQVLPKGLDVVEDPLIPRGPASRRIDAEGLAVARRMLVADGVLRSWVLDLATARQLGLESTANARRGPASTPRPGTSNVVLTQGTRSRADLIRDMGTGLLVTSMIGASISPTTGSYSRGASGFWVEDGEIRHAVNEITVAGSLPEMLKTIVPANDADPHRAVSVPSLLVEGLTIGA